MILERFYHDGLAQASWLLGCDITGEAIVIDPNRDVAQYVERARDRQLRLAFVTETHIHADFVSGSRELARKTGASLVLSGAGGPEWSYRFAAADGARLVSDGDVIGVGRVRIDVLHTPGHTPEHLSFVVTDTPASDRPVGIFTGDFVFVGDVGRPDLLERAARVADTMEPSARALFASLKRFRSLGDALQVWPGHGAGSACGKSLSALPQSTVGYERVANWGVAATDEDAFVREVLAGQPDPPPYFAIMKRVNRDGPPLIAGRAAPALGGHDALARAIGAGAFLLDARRAERFGAGHVPGSYNIPLNRAFAKWTGWFVPYDRDVHLIADSSGDAERAAAELALIGVDRVAAFSSADALDEWRRAGRPLAAVVTVAARELDSRPNASLTLVDVRDPEEWDGGRIPGARHIPLAQLPGRISELPADRPVAVYCQTGSRSAIAASWLAAQGRADVRDFPGGFAAWAAEGLPVEGG